MNIKEKLFNPNFVFNGDPKKYLKDYPVRSKNLEVIAKYNKPKALNPKFIKDGYIYLLRGAKNGQETGFYSREYAKKGTIENLGLDPILVAYAQSLNGNTPFISATTDLSTAAAFSLKQRIYILRIPVEDVYTLYVEEGLVENEIMIPDYISSEEIVNSFRFDKFRQIFGYLTEEIGLSITPEDLGETYETIKNPDMDKIERYIAFNEGASYLEPMLDALKNGILDSAQTDVIPKQMQKKL